MVVVALAVALLLATCRCGHDGGGGRGISQGGSGGDIAVVASCLLATKEDHS